MPIHLSKQIPPDLFGDERFYGIDKWLKMQIVPSAYGDRCIISLQNRSDAYS